MKTAKTSLAIALVLALAGSAQARHDGGPHVDVTIKRDGYGMPHVYAKTVFDLFYGYGYSVAQDRLFQMEMARRSTQGRVAEVLGEKFLAFDQSIRSNFTPDRIHRQIAALAPRQRDVLEGYAAGMNAWLAEVAAQPGRWLPKSFNDIGFEPEQWTAYDVAMVFVGTMANRFSDLNTEVDNLALLTALVDKHGKAGWQVFDQLKWKVDPKALTTVPAESGSYAVAQHPAGAPPAYALPRFDDVPPVLERLASDPISTGLQTTSNMWIVGQGKARGAKAILLNGPQFGWFAPAYTYGIGLHGAGFNIVGNTPFAYPCILFGHNGRVTWGSTAGVGDGVDIFAEQLDPKDPTRYRHNGSWKTMERRLDVIRVKGGTPVALEVFRTVHGIVTKVDAKNNVAYAKARAWEGHERSARPLRRSDRSRSAGSAKRKGAPVSCNR